MKHYKDVVILQEKLISVFCNKCNNEISKEQVGYGNYLSVAYTGGYAATLGDGIGYEFDLCETCLKEFMDTCKQYPDKIIRF